MGEPLVIALSVVATAGYAVAFAAACWSRRDVALWLFGGTWLANAAIVAVNSWLCGQPPLGNMYHVLIFLSLCFFPLFILLRCRHGMGWLVGPFAFASILPLIGSFFIERDLLWRRVPALQSPWFVPHVVSYMVSYALATVAFVLTVVALLRVWRAQGACWRWDAVPRALFSLDAFSERESDAAYQILKLAFPFMNFGLLSGALWAEEAWGVYWSWDPKETWSLITWTLYIIVFHCRLAPRLRRWCVLAHLCAFAALIVTFLVVNLLPKLGSILHSYA